MTNNRWTVVIALVLVFISCATTATLIYQNPFPAPKPYTCYALAPNQTIKIDGNLDDEAWQQVAWTDYFMDIVGPSKPLPRYQTRAKMRFDKNYLYVAAYLQEPHLVATIKTRNAVIYHDNDFEVFIGLSSTCHNAFNCFFCKKILLGPVTFIKSLK